MAEWSLKESLMMMFTKGMEPTQTPLVKYTSLTLATINVLWARVW